GSPWAHRGRGASSRPSPLSSPLPATVARPTGAHLILNVGHLAVVADQGAWSASPAPTGPRWPPPRGPVAHSPISKTPLAAPGRRAAPRTATTPGAARS